MAYCDYGAFVYKNGKRQYDLEDYAWSANNGCDSGISHGVIQDENFLVVCHKQGLPYIYHKVREGYDNNSIYEDIDYSGDKDPYDYNPFSFTLDGYRFYFSGGYELYDPYCVEMIAPNGDEWICEYDYHYGAGFEDE